MRRLRRGYHGSPRPMGMKYIYTRKKKNTLRSRFDFAVVEALVWTLSLLAPRPTHACLLAVGTNLIMATLLSSLDSTHFHIYAPCASLPPFGSGPAMFICRKQRIFRATSSCSYSDYCGVL